MLTQLASLRASEMLGGVSIAKGSSRRSRTRLGTSADPALVVNYTWSNVLSAMDTGCEVGFKREYGAKQTYVSPERIAPMTVRFISPVGTLPR